jgi:hypothetical protein
LKPKISGFFVVVSFYFGGVERSKREGRSLLSLARRASASGRGERERGDESDGKKKTRPRKKTHGSLNTGRQSPHIASAVLSAIGLGSTNSQSMSGAIAAAEASSRSLISLANAPGIRFDATETTPAAEIPSPWCRAACASSSLPDQHRTPREA